MALFMVMTVCLLVYAALEYRIRQALKDHEATFPDQKGKRMQKPHGTVGVPLFCRAFTCSSPGQWPLVLNLTDEHRTCFDSLANRIWRFYGVKYS